MAGAATRVTKAPEVRREELLDLALELCRTHGYEAMSVEQVTQAAGVAKGTFYHYFSSKADLQTQLVQRFGASLFDHLTAAAGRAEGTAAARLRVIMDAAAAYKTRHADVSQAAFLYRDENYALRHRLLAEWREQARLVLLPVIADGVADGSMRVASAEGATDIVLLLWLDAADHLWKRAVRGAGRRRLRPGDDRRLGLHLPGAGTHPRAAGRHLRHADRTRSHPSPHRTPLPAGQEPVMKRKTIVATSIGAAVVLALGGGYAYSASNNSPVVGVAQAAVAPLSVTASASGSLVAAHSAGVYPPAAGTVAKVLVADGDTVKAGDTLAVMATGPLKLAVAQARAALSAARAQGEAVSNGVPSAIDRSAASAALSAARSQVSTANLNYTSFRADYDADDQHRQADAARPSRPPGRRRPRRSRLRRQP